MSTAAIVHAMADAWDVWSKQATFPFGRRRTGYCINATRTGIEALRILGINTKPASVTMLVLNAAAEQLLRADVPVTQWPEHAWSIGLGSSDDVGPNGEWSGHLLIDGGTFTLDLSSEVMERAGRITINCPMILPPLPSYGERAAWSTHGHTVIMERAPQHNTWRKASGWKDRHPEIERELAMRTEHVLAVTS